MIRIERLREVLGYSPATGLFVWRQRLARKLQVGDVAGSLSNGYVVIRIDRRNYRAHRLAWLFVHGSWPAQEIDHINGDKADNRISNLRQADHRMNCENLRKASAHNATGILGAHTNGKRFCSKIQVDGKSVWLGYHDTPKAAHAVYVRAKRLLHEGCTL